MTAEYLMQAETHKPVSNPEQGLGEPLEQEQLVYSCFDL